MSNFSTKQLTTVFTPIWGLGRVKTWRRFLNPAVGLAVVFVSGCGSDGPTTIPVSGQITFSGGPPPAAGAVFFAPIDVEPGYPRRPGRARYDEDGSYAATSFEEGDGLVPGEYRVSVESWKSPPGAGPGGGAGVSYVGPDFNPPNLVVTEDQGRIEYDLDVPLAP